MNVVAQFVIYPLWKRQLGTETYGDILFLLSIMNTAVVSIGTACNYARMCDKRKDVKNSPYLIVLFGFTILVVLGAFAFSPVLILGNNMSIAIFFAALCGVTMWRFYADVEYRLSLNYVGYFLYYLAISIGYGIGAVIFMITKQWYYALLTGEILGVAFVLVRGKILRFDGKPAKGEIKPVLNVISTLFLSNVISNLIYNGDRIILKAAIGGAAVTTYYLASLIGKTMTLITTPLNSVIIGYLMRYEGRLKKKTFALICVAAVVISIIGMLGCYLASVILIPILYPGELPNVKPFLMLGSLAQIVYFVGSIITVLLLRFGKKRDQMYVNVSYAIVFGIACIPSTYKWGLMGFCISYLVTTVIRLVIGLALSYWRSQKMLVEEPAT